MISEENFHRGGYEKAVSFPLIRREMERLLILLAGVVPLFEYKPDRRQT